MSSHLLFRLVVFHIMRVVHSVNLYLKFMCLFVSRCHIFVLVVSSHFDFMILSHNHMSILQVFILLFHWFIQYCLFCLLPFDSLCWVSRFNSYLDAVCLYMGYTCLYMLFRLPIHFSIHTFLTCLDDVLGIIVLIFQLLSGMTADHKTTHPGIWTDLLMESRTRS